jgi:hypothetical protein
LNKVGNMDLYKEIENIATKEDFLRFMNVDESRNRPLRHA